MAVIVGMTTGINMIMTMIMTMITIIKASSRFKSDSDPSCRR